MNGSRKLLLAATIVGVAVLGSVYAKAGDLDVGATLTATETVNVTLGSSLDFGTIEYTAGNHTGAIQLGPDGTVATTGTNLTTSGSGTAGTITTTTSGSVLEITCETSGIVSDATTDLTITPVVWDITAATYAGASNTCGGLGVGAITIDTSGGGANPTLYIGGAIAVGAQALDPTAGNVALDTATGNGDPIAFRFVYQ